MKMLWLKKVLVRIFGEEDVTFFKQSGAERGGRDNFFAIFFLFSSEGGELEGAKSFRISENISHFILLMKMALEGCNVSLFHAKLHAKWN